MQKRVQTTKDSNNGDKKENDKTLRSFRQWIDKLDWPDLLEALSFRVSNSTASSLDATQGEFDLLYEMVRLQPSLPTPIHPRAITFQPASVKGKAYFDQRTNLQDRKARFDCPRLFQLISRESTSNKLNHEEAELLSLLAGRSTPRSVKGKWHCRKKGKHPSKSVVHPTYDVVARQFRQPDGEMLSCAGSYELLCADRFLLESTVLQNSCDDLSINFTSSTYWCRLYPTEGFDFSDSPVHRLIGILRIASRGNFGTVAISRNETKRWFAPWFDPEVQWFHLSTYLASRFEVALWQAFQGRKETATSLSFPALCNIDDTSLESLLKLAAAKSIKDTMKEERQQAISNNVRDSTLWSLLSQNDLHLFGKTMSRCSKRQLVEKLCFSPIAELGMKSQVWRRRLFLHFQTLCAIHTERLLIDDTLLDKSSRTGIVSKILKRKKKKIQKIVSTSEKLTSTGVADEERIESSASSEDSEDGSFAIRLLLAPQRLCNPKFPRKDACLVTGITSHQRNLNTVFILSVIEEVLMAVFHTVGICGRNTIEDGEDHCGFSCTSETIANSFHLVGSEEYATSKQSEKASRSVRPLNPAPFTDHEEDQSIKSKSAEAQKQIGIQLEWSFSKSLIPNLQKGNENTTTTIRTSNSDKLKAPGCGSISSGLFQRPDPYTFDSAGWECHGNFIFDDWGRLRGFDGRDESILAEFFHSQEVSEKKREEMHVASSTAASVASSLEEEHLALAVTLDDLGVSPLEDIVDDSLLRKEKSQEVDSKSTTPMECLGYDSANQSRVSSPSSTPPPTISPILVSLSDLSDLRKDTLDNFDIPATQSLTSNSTTVMNLSSPSNCQSQPQTVLTLPHDIGKMMASCEGKRNSKQSLKAFPRYKDNNFASKGNPKRRLSRDDHDVRVKTSLRRSVDVVSSARKILGKPIISRDDHDIKNALRETPLRFGSYRNAVVRATLSSSAKSSSTNRNDECCHFDEDSSRNGIDDNCLCTQSETALDSREEYYCWNETSSRNINNDVDNTVGKVKSPTFPSIPPQESEGVMILREERNTYRDMCLTLGAEVAKLKTLLAAHQPLSHSLSNPSQQSFQSFQGTSPIDPSIVQRTFNIAPRARTLGAMSDAGYRGEYESLASEDEVGKACVPGSNSRQLSSGATVAESDTSLDHTICQKGIHVPTGFQSREHPDESLLINGLQSRLARDIYQFIESTNTQLRKQDTQKQTAMERIARLVCTVWPRAQVKVYGSHVTGLCVPASDLDIVVCLPAVHKNAVADAAGALEGRNAIRETPEKQLARRLKSESWIDPRSMKVIDRTVVPVIKVSTKDTKAKTLNLDISFDSPGHHGLEAVHMVKSILDELPMLRPLVVVLKQFLIDRSLLGAYAGGLGSYCLFLMTARYLQEQASGSDVGSLLMGFLDFYGNHFDPRTTAISVRHRMFFTRPRSHSRPPSLWVGELRGNRTNDPPRSMSSFRRNSFSDRKNSDFMLGLTPVSRTIPIFHPPTFHPTSDVLNDPNAENAFDHGFDPLFVEDPLSEGNNVGRNAFRICQVQRSFSDAHRALVAALEWDMHSTGDSEDANEFPLLKCLLQSEDVVLDL